MMKKTKINIKGMHCKACEIIVKERLQNIKGVSSVSVNSNLGVAYITHKTKISHKDIKEAVKKAGYDLGKKDNDFFSRSINDYVDVLIIFIIVSGGYLLLTEFGFLSLSIQNTVRLNSIGAVFLAGLTASISTCAALVGGIVLGLGARYSELHPHVSLVKKFQPQLFFHIGRIGSFIVFGGLMGFVGSVILISETGIGILTIIASLLMLFIGLQLTKLVPFLDTFSISLPSRIYSLLGIKEKQNKPYSHIGALVLGGSTFFVPCGFTQAAQLFAVSSGSFFSGAYIMGIFSLGTLPGLIGIGSISSFLKGNIGRIFFKIIGVLLMWLSLLNIVNGYRLIGLTYKVPFLNTNKIQDKNKIIVKDGFQIVKMDQEAYGYRPNFFTVKKGIPVRWIVNSKTTYSCASSLVAPALNIRKNLELGENVFEFIPKETGTIRFSCSMGMYVGEFKVIE
ncbi:MAG: sulfite exporter TauE/SafE family protein [Candidatus Woesearchaeota archaeon]